MNSQHGCVKSKAGHALDVWERKGGRRLGLWYLAELVYNSPE